MSDKALVATVVNNNSTALAPTESYEMDVRRVLQQTIAIQKLMESVLKEKEHFGEIPGVQAKPGERPKKCLFKSGAEKLCLMFRMRPEYEIISRREEPTFISFEIRCRLYHITLGVLLGEGIGSINSRESKYLNQTSAKACPHCGAAAIIKGKDDYGGGWLCFAKKGGCGAKFSDDDKAITEQAGKPAEAKVWELHNTLIKMGQKRALVAATLITTAASDVFTQDLDDLEEAVPGAASKPQTQPTPQEPVTPQPQVSRDVDNQRSEPSRTASGSDVLKAEKVRDLVIAIKRAGIAEKNRMEWMAYQLNKPVTSSKDLSIDEIELLIARAHDAKGAA